MKSLIRRLANAFGYAILRRGALGVPNENYVSLLNAFAEMIRSECLPSLPAVSREQALLAARLTGITAAQALYLLDRLSACLNLEGDVCELGVAQGATSAFIAQAIRPTGKRLWLLDSFQGLPTPSGQDRLEDDVLELGAMERYEGQMSFPATMVSQRLAEIGFPSERTEIVAGFIDDSFGQGHVPSKVAFAFVDLDFYEPILLALRYLDTVLVDGGTVLVHDYGFFSSGAKIAVDEFLQSCSGRYAADFPKNPIFHCCSLRRENTQ